MCNVLGSFVFMQSLVRELSHPWLCKSRRRSQLHLAVKDQVLPDWPIRDTSGIEMGAGGDYANTNELYAEELDRPPDQS